MNDEKFSLFPVAAGIASRVLAVRDEPLTMTSREIADLAGIRHDNVKRAVNTLADRGIIKFPQIEEIPTATKPMSVFVFSGPKGKRDSIVVLAQVSPEFTGALVDRWMHLEEEIKRLHDAESEKLLKNLAAKELSTLRPAVESLNKAQGGKTFAQKAKAVYEMAESQRRACSWRLEPAEAETLNQRIIHGLLDLGVLKPDGGLKAQAFVTRYQDVLRLYALECGAVVGSQSSP